MPTNITAILNGDVVYVELPAGNGCGKKVLKCTVTRGDTTHEASLYPVDTFMLRANEAVSERGIAIGHTLTGIKREQITLMELETP